MISRLEYIYKVIQKVKEKYYSIVKELIEKAIVSEDVSMPLSRQKII